MAKVITFSTVFPLYHPRKGEPTNFVEKIHRCIGSRPFNDEFYLYMQQNYDRIHEFEPKYHTIRSGNRWKAGDKFSPRIWSGKPYHSKQIIISPDLEIKKVWPIGMYYDKLIEAWCWDFSSMKIREVSMVAKNDGLSIEDFEAWFPCKKDFFGQIICWDERIDY